MATSTGNNISGNGGVNGTNTSQGNGTNNALTNLDLDQFLKLMIAELQNQDPLNPMDNTQILQQIGEMQQINASSKLSGTLDAVLLGQNLSSASTMIGKSITGLTDDGKTVTGVVDKITVTGGVPMLHIGDSTVQLKNVKEVDNQPVGTSTT